MSMIGFVIFSLKVRIKIFGFQPLSTSVHNFQKVFLSIIKSDKATLVSTGNRYFMEIEINAACKTDCLYIYILTDMYI